MSTPGVTTINAPKVINHPEAASSIYEGDKAENSLAADDILLVSQQLVRVIQNFTNTAIPGNFGI